MLLLRRLTLLSLCLALPLAAAAEDPATGAPVSQELDKFLQQGQVAEGLQHFSQPATNADRFSLAVLQASHGLQQFSAGMNRLSFQRDNVVGQLPFFRAVIPGGPLATETATPAGIAALFTTLREGLRAANQTLVAIDDAPFKVEINLSQWRMDFDGNGAVAPQELLLDSMRAAFPLPHSDEDVVVRFDSADAKWLQGYTHILSAALDVLMAYDWSPAWNQMAHHLFRDCDPVPAMARLTTTGSGREIHTVADLVAGLHAMPLPLIDPEGPARALAHLKSAVECSRVSWQRIQAETDNDHEWVPSPIQTGPNGAAISGEEVAGWMLVLDELERVATGAKLVPHWRIREGMGINLQKVADSPPPFDLLMFIHGGGFIPYIEEGDVSSQNTWRDLTSPFGGRFGGFALWVN